ncbi:phosphate propanoyltransferase [Sedimentibacter hydroxybenzoicus DSM 7310]|uniref:Phosphate propanoyltransferase n=1 Tax=Sedimentibacter hydroxybenzoicus DSM 7310 TaxID=1123245 RepID=A0A974BL36_SEDHY|nr:phosphate propanoyltransferase [Sedimentibacter hydroxybenzoicus]NYB74846.1 phosphate propanoyltransferase [Sedimentibacter hydroxybenzoicus DSM 7310]
MNFKVTVGLSNKHVHLSKEHIDILFGEGHELTPMKDLSQPGQFACEEKVDLVGPKRTINGVRILGPARKESQIEISFADGFTLGLKDIPVRDSGKLDGTPGIKLVGPKGEVEVDKGVIAAARHIHMHTSDAEKFGLKDKDTVKVRVGGPRGLTFDNVLIRVHDTYALDMHLDVEEGNAAGLSNCDEVEVIVE